MSKGYFSFFPTIQYGNNIVTNILAKVRFDQSVSKNLAVFYPYTVKEGERPDHVANWYYNDPYLDWIVYLSNNIVDPYFQWPLGSEAFGDFITAKYGTIANAQSQVAFFRNNYYADDTVLTPAAYLALSASQRFFWAPVDTLDGLTVGYERKSTDVVLETNKVLQLNGSFSNATVGTVITQGNPVTGRAQIAWANGTVLFIQHIIGAFANGTCSTGTIANTRLAVDNIPTGTSTYFSPISIFDYQDELNESRKNIRLLHANYVDLVVRDMKDVMSQ